MRCAHVKEERGKLMELMDERVEGWLMAYFLTPI